jgi:voltage-gated potassium channel
MSKYYWSSVLLLEIFFLIFLTSFFPENWQPVLFPLIYSALYLTAVGGLEKNKKPMFWVAGLILVAQVAFKLFNMPVVEAISKMLNFIFFSFIVVSLIRQISSAQHVTRRVILEAINGYLLLGLVFTFLIGLMIQFDPASFNFSGAGEGTLQNSMYFGFVTFATLGFGDLLPIKPYAKSLSILIAVCGQLYVAVIIALLVGKFSTQSAKNDKTAA